MLKYACVTSVLSALFAYYFLIFTKSSVQNDEKKLSNVLRGLLAVEKAVELPKSLPVAIGFGSCLDLLVHGIHLLNSSYIKPPLKPQYHERIKSFEDLADMFAFFMVEGAAAERYVPSALLKELVVTAEALPGVRWAGGGNAPVMGGRFIRDGFTNILIGAQASKKLQSFFPTSMKFSNSGKEDDDIHLILEYKAGERWGNYVASRANRFIVHSDINNPYIKSLENFHSIVKKVQPRLVIISALQMLDNFPFPDNNLRKERLLDLENMLKDVPQSILTHFEMASFGEPEMMQLLLDHVMPFVDSMGLNEQELPNVVNMIKQGHIIKIANSNPRTANVLDDMRDLYSYYRKNSRRGLSRIHVHTLSFQVVLTSKSSSWKNTRAGAARASLTAHRHVCGVNEINIKNARLIMDESFSVSAKMNHRIYFNETSPISCWDEEDYEVCVAPVLVCTRVRQTVGGGDNITPAGLMPQI